MRSAVTMLGVALGVFACAGCQKPSPPASSAPQRACGLSIWYQPSGVSSQVTVQGSWDDWSAPGTPMPPVRTDGWQLLSLDLAPGEYTYAIDDGGQLLADPYVGTTAGPDGADVTWVDVPSCDVPLLDVASASGSATGEASIGVTFLAARFGDAVDPSTVSATDHDGTPLPSSAFTVDAATGTITIAATGLTSGKHAFAIAANDTKGRPADQAVATVWIEAQAFDPRDTVIYQVMVDRFRGPAGALTPPASMGGRAGGTVDGVTAAVMSGEIQALGVNTIWLSPLQANPDGTFLGLDGRPYTGYHGYWPSEPRTPESLQASDASLAALVTAAHDRGIRILFDVVPHHVHQEHPYFAAHVNDGWFLYPDGSCVCGTTCSWDTEMQSCAFASYLPTLNWNNPNVADQVSSDILWWVDHYDADGIRIDAVPMLPRAATRRIVGAIRGRFDNPGHASFLLGEDFTTDFDSLRYYLGSFGLDSEFHFPLMWSLRAVIAQQTGAMSDVQATFEQGVTAFAGSNAVMSLIIGNHDVSRFSSCSAGDDGGDTWVPAPQSTDPTVYAKQVMALGLVYALPGAPTVYYGDEIGLAGKSDPDSRRVMPADSALSALEIATRTSARALGAARTCATALRRGTYRSLYADAETWVFTRELAGADPVVVVASRNPTASLSIPLPGVTAGSYVDLMSGQSASLQPELTNLRPAPFSVALYVPTGSACAHLAPAP